MDNEAQGSRPQGSLSIVEIRPLHVLTAGH